MVERDSRRIVARLPLEGWTRVATKGSHAIFKKEGRHVVVPHPRKDIAIGTAHKIAKDAGWME